MFNWIKDLFSSKQDITRASYTSTEKPKKLRTPYHDGPKKKMKVKVVGKKKSTRSNTKNTRNQSFRDTEDDSSLVAPSFLAGLFMGNSSHSSDSDHSSYSGGGGDFSGGGASGSWDSSSSDSSSSDSGGGDSGGGDSGGGGGGGD